MASPQGNPEATEIWSERSSTNANGKRTAHRAWCVINVVNEDQALATVPEAAINQQHPQRQEVKVETNGATNLENGGPFAWKVTADYSIPDDGSDQQNNRDAQKDDPLNEPPQYSWEEETVSLETDRDADGNPILNSALEAYDPPDEIQKTVNIYTVTWNVAKFNAVEAEALTGMLSGGAFDTPFGSWGKGEVQLKSWKPDGPIIGKTPKYVRVVAEYEIRSRKSWPCPANATPFDTRRIDLGWDSFREKNGATVPCKILTLGGQPPSAQVRLDGAGGPFEAQKYAPDAGDGGFQSLAAGSPKGAIVERKPLAVFLWYRHYGFSDIGGMLP